MKHVLMILVFVACTTLSAFTLQETARILDIQESCLRDFMVHTTSRFDVQPALYELYPIAYTFYSVYFGEGFDQAVIYDWENSNWVQTGEVIITFMDGHVTQLLTPVDDTNMRFTFTWENDHIVQSLQQLDNQGVWQDFILETYDWSGDNLDYAMRQALINGVWISYQQFFWTYSGSQVTECRIQVNNINQWRDETRMTATWTGDRISEVLEEYWEGSWEYDCRDTYTYDEAGRCASDLYEYYDGGTWIHDYRDTYSYAEGDISQVLGEYWTGANWINDELISFFYTGGMFAEQLEQEWDGSAWENDTKFVVTHYDVDEDEVSPIMGLSAYPNPFNPDVTVAFSLASPQQVTAQVYDVRGRLTTTLHSGALPVGDHIFTWNGLDASGQPVGSGVYLIRVETVDGAAVRKATLLK